MFILYKLILYYMILSYIILYCIMFYCIILYYIIIYIYMCVCSFLSFLEVSQGHQGIDPSLAEAGGTCWVVSRLVT
jgi:hypothetical protein